MCTCTCMQVYYIYMYTVHVCTCVWTDYNEDGFEVESLFPTLNSYIYMYMYIDTTNPWYDSVGFNYSLGLTTDHLLGLLHIMFEETVVEDTSVMDIHVSFFICKNVT